MRKIIIMLGFLLTACGSQEEPTSSRYKMIPIVPTYHNVAEDARPHFVEFLEYCKQSSYAGECDKNLKQLVSLTISDNISKNDKVVGLCYVSFSGNYRWIEIKSGFADKDSMQFKLAVWHEMGHCLMGLDHNDQMPHIMNSYVLPNIKIFNEWPDLVKKMFDETVNIHGFGENTAELSSCSL